MHPFDFQPPLKPCKTAQQKTQIYPRQTQLPMRPASVLLAFICLCVKLTEFIIDLQTMSHLGRMILFRTCKEFRR